MKADQQPTFRNRLRYAFDRTLSKGPLILGGWIALVSLALVGLISILTYLFSLNPNKSFFEIAWDMLLQALAPNPVEYQAGPAPFLIAMLVITLLGLFMVSVFIGIITNAIDHKIQSLRLGRSIVLEKNHTVILGWDEHIFTIIAQLVLANQNKPRSSIVIMGEKDKLEMEEDIRRRVGPPGKTEIICRSGSPMDEHDLDIVNLPTARSIILLPPDKDDGDSSVIKSLLAITQGADGRERPYHIVTEIHDAINLEPALLVGKQEATVLLMSDIIAHITAQTCRQSGLSIVYTELMNFEGDDVYFQEEPALVGRTYGEALLMYEDSCLIGLLPAGEKPRLNPPGDTVIGRGDQVIAISEDDDTVKLSRRQAPPIQPDQICLRQPAPLEPERTLVLGWNRRAATIVLELDHYVAKGSQVTVVAEREPADLSAIRPRLANLSLAFECGNFEDRRVLNRLQVETFQHVIVLADLDDSPIQVVDARTLITLLHLRDVNEKAGRPFSIVSEMLDVRNRNLAKITHVDDFIVSDEISSLIMAQIAENKSIAQVFDDLFYPAGSEIYLKPAVDYIRTDSPVNFYTVVEAARRRGESAIGYRCMADAGNSEKNFGVVVNPDKSAGHLFHPDDRLIVLAES